MNDRELLEFAAKAADIDLMDSIWHETLEGKAAVFLESGRRPWDPLNNDGDALRLAVKLEMDLSLTEFGAWVNDSIDCTDTDPYAATRMAIVLAAAEIGRTM